MDERHSTYEGGQDIRDRTFAFACRIVAFCGKLHQIGGVARMMVPQLLNCGTSPYAQMEEARAAESDRDFVSKCAVGYKEIREAHGRLRIHEACDIGPREEAASLRGEANQLVAIIRNKRRNAGLTRRKRPKKPDA